MPPPTPADTAVDPSPAGPRRALLDATPGPLHPAAREALLSALDNGWADPRRLHSEGRRAAHLLDILQELRDAGAEVIQMGHSRIVASSYFADSGSTVSVDGTSLSRPIVVLAIGDPATLSGALKIPGGIVDTVKRLGASSTIEERSVLTIDALHPTSTPRYAAPVPEATTAPSGS